MALQKNSSYAFFLHFVGGGYAYFTTFTVFDVFGKNHREVRSPDLVRHDRFVKTLNSIDADYFTVTNPFSYENWMLGRGWALVERDFARQSMPQWLAARECITGAAGIFVDIKVASPSALGRGISKGKRQKVINKHLMKCFICGVMDIPITMHHIRPFGLGGETTARNLVPLCEPCNQAKGATYDPSLYEGPTVELSLVGRSPKDGWHHELAGINGDLMFTRCDLH